MSSGIDVSLKDDDDFISKLTKYLAVGKLTDFADQVAPVVLSTLKIEAPKKTGAMASELRYRRVSGVDAKSVFCTIYFEGPREPLKWVLEGTFPHVIKPRHPELPGHPKMLHWVEGGTHHFRHEVNHPGIVNPSNFPEHTWRQVQPLVDRVFKKVTVGS